MQNFGVFKIKGITFKVHPSWWLILALFTLSSKGEFARVFGEQLPAWQGWCVGILTSLLLFYSVFLCELGRCFMALNEGLKVRQINLFLFTVLTRTSEKSSNSLSDFRIAISGPFLNLIIILLCILFINLFPNISSLIIFPLRQSARINSLLILFNLLPIIPLNGGIVVKSLVWYFTNDQRKGYIFAIKLGKYLSLFFILIGAIIIFNSGGINGLFFIIIGWFGFSSSRSEGQTLALQDALLEILIKDISSKKFRVIDETKSLKSLSEIRFSTSQENKSSEWVLLTNSGRWVGFITDSPLKEVPAKDWDKYFLANYKRPLTDLPSVLGKQPIWHAVLKLEKIKEGRLLVFNSAGLPSGTVDKADLGERTLKKLGIILPSTFIEIARKNNTYPLGLSLPKIVQGMINSGLIQESDLDRLTE